MRNEYFELRLPLQRVAGVQLAFLDDLREAAANRLKTTKFGEDNATQHLRWQFNFIRTGEDGGIACCGDDFYLHVNMQIDLFDAIAVPTLEDIDGECK